MAGWEEVGLKPHGFEPLGFKTLKRKIILDLRFPIPDIFPETLPVIIPDLIRLKQIPKLSSLLFFDLETTGLSGGAGTIAFLAAFARFCPERGSGKNEQIEITQYLLLDYPGESDFVERVVEELNPGKYTDTGNLPLVVSYNGKSFDSQIIKTRCLMNGISPPEFSHADLLHPARRLWKRVLPDCSQATIEVSVLGLDRSGDVSGALAPEIWFSFLRSGRIEDLLSVCDHNARDVTGLASLFLALSEIAARPEESQSKYRFDEEALALTWRAFAKKNKNSPLLFGGGEACDCYAQTGMRLLENAARKGSVRSAIALAIDAEWRQKDPALALGYTEAAIKSIAKQNLFWDELEQRRKRLEKKLQKAHGIDINFKKNF